MIIMQAKILRVIDRYLGSLLLVISWFLLPLLGNSSDKKNMLVVKLWAVGESILTLPSVQSVSEKGFNVTALCTSQNISAFRGQDFIKNVIILDIRNPLSFLKILRQLRRGSLSVAVDADPYARLSAMFCAFSGAGKRIGFENRKLLYTESVKVNEDRHAVMIYWDLFSKACQIEMPMKLVPVMSENPGFIVKKNSVAIHAGSAPTSISRRWPEKNFAKICDYFAGKKWDVYLVGSAVEKEINLKIISLCKSSCPIDVSGKLSLSQLAGLLSKVGIVIANDSGPMHISASVGTRTVGLFGPNHPKRFGPFCKNCVGLRKEGPICIYPFREKFPSCRHGHMDGLTTDEVIAAVEKLLKPVS